MKTSEDPFQLGFVLKLPSLKLSLIWAGTSEHEQRVSAKGISFL